MIAEFIKTFPYGSSVRTLYRISRPLADRLPLRHHMLKIERADGVTWLAAFTSGEVYCFVPPCAADLADIEAAVAAAPSLVQ